MASDTIQVPGYEILRLLGSGGMSTVYLAVQRSLDRKVALKIMRRSGDSASDDARQMERRFLLEGRMMAKLSHRNIVAVYDIVSNESIAYIAMEYLGGGALSDRMRSGIALADAVSVIVQIAGALEFAHGHGVVHRDLKPANIMFRENGTPILTDFGIARYQDRSATRLTQTGMLVGTPTYMSPEQINGQEVDGRSDQYSLGILFYELLTGSPPFRGDTPIAVLMMHLTQPPPPLPDELRAFQDVFDRLLAKDREARYANLSEFSDDLKSRVTDSDTLLMRLHIDPNQTSSEQLRALGFFTSTPTGENILRSLPNRPTPPGGRPAPNLVRATPQPGKPTGTAPSTGNIWKQKKLLIAAIAVIVLLVVAVGFFTLRIGHRLSKDEADLVTFWLERAEQRVAEKKLVTPAEDSAYEYVQKALQKDPENAKAQALLDGITTTLGEEAQLAVAAEKFDEAADLNNQALLVRPDNPELRAFAARIKQLQQATQSKQRIAQLIAQADTARTAGRVFGEGGAYALLGQARALAGDDPAPQQRIQQLVNEELATPRKELAAGQPAAAEAALDKLQPYLAAEKAYVDLRGQVDAALKKQEAEKQIAAEFARADTQLRAGHLVDPGGDNAYETLGALEKSAADDKRTAELRGALAKALLADARRLDGSDQAQRALDRVGLALQVAPDLADAQKLKDQIEKRLGARGAQLAQMLGAARQAIAEKRFVPPAQNDAHTALTATLKFDPSNAEATQLLAELPKRIADTANDNARTDVAAAIALVEAGQRIFPQDPALGTLAQTLKAKLADERLAKQKQSERDGVAKTLSGQAPTAQQLRAASDAIATLLASDAADKEALQLRKRWIDVIDGELQAVESAAQFDALATLLAEQKKNLGAEPAYDKVVQSLPALRAKVAAAEQAKLEAQRGELVLNAYPWGKVESVLDANRQPVALPTDATTPFTLTLPAGSYVITFRHPDAAKPAQVIAKVEAQKRSTANAAFTTISAQEYFSRAGW
ncbi:MAG TPA: protein kinase [Rudaea sp.]|nr:protein kinase [Rudaea sp.]